MTSPVLFETFPTANGHHWAVATLNAPAALNALSLPMVRLLQVQLDQWEQDENIVGVTLQAAGPKSFCAGGDLRSLYATLQSGHGDQAELTRAFFTEEYTLDNTIHNYSKPFMCWGHGLVMGGGVGLFIGASHRVVTTESRLSMPEISIGLYPDVGGSWFLPRMPGRSGLFAGLTGAMMTAADALYAGLADSLVEHASKDSVNAHIAKTNWANDPAARSKQLTDIIALHAAPETGPSPLQTNAHTIDSLMAGDSLQTIAERLAHPQTDEWLEKACDNFRRGSPTSAALTYALWKRGAAMNTLADVYRLEFNVSLACCAHHDMQEGIRAVLVDKDRKPRWNPPDLASVNADYLKDFFRPRFDGPHPLKNLQG